MTNCPNCGAPLVGDDASIAERFPMKQKREYKSS